jgi:hypothetical protein
MIWQVGGLEPHVIVEKEKKMVEKISIRVSFIYFNLHPMFWFWLGFCFILNLCSSVRLGYKGN